MHPVVYNACLATGIAWTSAGAGLAAGLGAALATAGVLTLACTFATVFFFKAA